MNIQLRGAVSQKNGDFTLHFIKSLKVLLYACDNYTLNRGDNRSKLKRLELLQKEKRRRVQDAKVGEKIRRAKR